MKGIWIVFFWVLLMMPNQVFSQILEQLEKDKNIEWVIETEFEYVLEKEDRMNFYETKVMGNGKRISSRVEMLKMGWGTYFSYINYNYLLDEILWDVQREHRKVFSLKNPKQVVSWRDYRVVDTLVYVDSDTHKEKMIISKGYKLNETKSFKMKQLWFYNKKTFVIANVVTGLIPVAWIEDRNGQIKKEDLFIIPMANQIAKRPDINDENLVWMKKTRDFVDFKDSKPVKGHVFPSLKEYFFEYPKSGKNKVYHGWEDDSFTPNQFVNFLEEIVKSGSETVFIADPVTKEDVMTVVKLPPFSFDQIVGQMVRQIWFYDPKKKSLNSYLFEIGPYYYNVNHGSTVFKFRF